MWDWKEELKTFRLKMDWKELALFQGSMLSLGAALGAACSEKKNKNLILGFAVAFGLLYLPFVMKIFGFSLQEGKMDGFEEDTEDFEDIASEMVGETVPDEDEGYILKIYSEE